MVRAAAAGTHPSLHGESAAARNRTGRSAGLRALLVRMATSRTGSAGRGRRCGRQHRFAARRFRSAGCRVGNRDSSCARQRIRSGVAGRAEPRRPSRVDAHRAAQSKRRTRTESGAHDTDCARVTPQPRDLGALAPMGTTDATSSAHRLGLLTDRRVVFEEIAKDDTLRTQVEMALAEIVHRVDHETVRRLSALLGLTAATFEGHKRCAAGSSGIGDAGRWALFENGARRSETWKHVARTCCVVRRGSATDAREDQWLAPGRSVAMLRRRRHAVRLAAAFVAAFGRAVSGARTSV